MREFGQHNQANQYGNNSKEGPALLILSLNNNTRKNHTSPLEEEGLPTGSEEK
jgi:hypothetical protein